MRYDNWDVILFPRDSLVPIQEFRTACYASQDEDSRQLQTLTCYISSLPTSTPFRISIHSWASPAMPSALIESRRKINQRVVYVVQVIVDGVRVLWAEPRLAACSMLTGFSHGLYELGSKWPQEIMTEKRSITTPQVQSSRQASLEFPPFRQNVLWQSSWDAREHPGRIKVLLSEQLVRKTNTPGELDFGAANDVACFAFQHAPRDILEQAGVSWPIRNPLYLPSTLGVTAAQGLPSPQIPIPYMKAHELTTEHRTHSPLSRQPQPTFARPQNPDPYARPRTDPPKSSQFPKPPRRGYPMVEPCTDTYDDMSVESWPTRQSSSHAAADVSMSDMNYTTSRLGHQEYSWRSTAPHHGDIQAQNPTTGQARQEKNNRQVVVTLRDDQLGQIIEALSPPKQPGQRLPQPKMAGMSVPTRPSAASLARKASYQELSTKNKTSYTNEFARPPTAFPLADRVPTPQPFVGQPQTVWDSDVSMRDTSSVFSNLTRQLPQPPAEPSAAQIPATDGSIRSKKEGMHPLPGLPLSHDTRHDQSLLSEIDADQQFIPGHKGMSSMDSTDRLERQLFSALGEELNNFNGATELESFDTPAAKRKRQGTFGAERDRSPIAKMVREEGKNVQDVVEVPRLRGGE